MKYNIEVNLRHSGVVDEDDWDVVAYDWRDGADANIAQVKLNAEAIGRVVGQQYRDSGYENIHLIAHSAGSALINEAAKVIVAGKSVSQRPSIHTTFLDAFEGLSGIGSFQYGRYSDWSDHYFTPDVLTNVYTDGSLLYAHNVNVAGLDDPIAAALGSTHNFPYHFYNLTTILPQPGAQGYGFGLSREGGNYNPSAYPNGQGPSLFTPRDSMSLIASAADAASLGPDVRRDPAINFESVTHQFSAPGAGEVAGSQVALQIGSPASFGALIQPDNAVNFITFEADFTSGLGSEGLLSVYWDEVLVGVVDERFVLDGMQEYIFDLPDTFDPSAYTLAFRLDPFTDVASSVLIDNVSTGFVPEPAGTAVLGFAAAMLLRRRRAA